jgi:hypothetical protein
MKPQLLIGYDSDLMPSDATCSACGDSFPGGDNVDITPQQRLTWFKALFNFHVLEKHSGEKGKSHAKPQ